MANQEKKTLAIVIREYYPSIGGAQSQAKRLARELKSKGWKVIIFTQKLQSTHPSKEFIGGAEVIRISSARIRFLGSLLFLFKLFSHLVFKRREIDVMLGFMLKQASAVAALASKVIGRRIALSTAGAGQYGDVQTSKRIPFGWLQLWMCSFADAFIAVSPQVKEELIREGFAEEKIYQIPNGVELKSIEAPDKKFLKEKLGLPQGIIIIYTGRLSVEKGVGLLLEGFIKLKDKKDVSLVIIGEGPLYPHLKKIVERESLRGKVIFIEPQDEVWEYLFAAEIFVLPSISEGMSVSLLEAMAAELAVAASDISANSLLIENEKDGLLFKSGDSDELRRCLEKFIADETARKFMGKSARNKILNNYSLEKMIESYNIMLSKLIAARS